MRRRSPPFFLVLFTGWVLSPFLAMLAADRASSRGSAPARQTLQQLMVIIPLASLAIYGYLAVSPPRPKPAAPILLVPRGPWLVLAITLTIA